MVKVICLLSNNSVSDLLLVSRSCPSYVAHSAATTRDAVITELTSGTDVEQLVCASQGYTLQAVTLTSPVL